MGFQRFGQYYPYSFAGYIPHGLSLGLDLPTAFSFPWQVLLTAGTSIFLGSPLQLQFYSHSISLPGTACGDWNATWPSKPSSDNLLEATVTLITLAFSMLVKTASHGWHQHLPQERAILGPTWITATMASEWIDHRETIPGNNSLVSLEWAGHPRALFSEVALWNKFSFLYLWSHGGCISLADSWDIF